MADLVIDEWLWADLAGDNGPEKQRETFQFLEAMRRANDRLVIARGSKFNLKADAFWKHTDLHRRTIARFFKDELLYNSQRCVLLDELELELLPQEIAADIKDDDYYLVRSFLTCNAEAIVTTDNPLAEKLKKHGIICEHRDQFLPGYIKRHP